MNTLPNNEPPIKTALPPKTAREKRIDALDAMSRDCRYAKTRQMLQSLIDEMRDETSPSVYSFDALIAAFQTELRGRALEAAHREQEASHE